MGTLHAFTENNKIKKSRKIVGQIRGVFVFLLIGAFSLWGNEKKRPRSGRFKIFGPISQWHKDQNYKEMLARGALSTSPCISTFLWRAQKSRYKLLGSSRNMTFDQKRHNSWGFTSLYLLFHDRLGLKRPNPRSFSFNVNTALIILIFVKNPRLLLTRPIPSPNLR